ncbi:hypothetical protein FRB99_000697 [Tulasnella sp. 403]|nr:hypothetical protein FRB99_000697 [Tulasnella sp. 403]
MSLNLCPKSLSWMQNAKGLDPCGTLVQVLSTCGLEAPGSQFTPDEKVPGPVPDFSHVLNPPSYCGCTGLVYNLYSACSVCRTQDVNVTTWQDWHGQCHPPLDVQTNQTNLPTPVPIWAFAPSNYSGGIFDVNFSQNVSQLANRSTTNSHLLDDDASELHQLFTQAARESGFSARDVPVTSAELAFATASPSLLPTDTSNTFGSALPILPDMTTQKRLPIGTSAAIIVVAMLALTVLGTIFCYLRGRRGFHQRMSAQSSEQGSSSFSTSDTTPDTRPLDLEEAGISVWQIQELSGYSKRLEAEGYRFEGPPTGLDPHGEVRRNMVLQQQHAIFKELLEKREKPV